MNRVTWHGLSRTINIISASLLSVGHPLGSSFVAALAYWKGSTVVSPGFNVYSLVSLV